MPSIINIQLLTDDQGGDAARALPYAGTSNTGREAARVLAREVDALAAGIGRGRMRVQIDTVAGVAATITLTCTNSSATAGDALYIGGIRHVAVAATADPTAQQYSTTTGSDNAYAASIAAAINTGRDFSAVASTNTVIITARNPGSAGNAIAVVKNVTTAGTVTFSGAALAGGVDAGARPSMTVACAAIGTNGQTFRVGTVTLTMAAAPANENEFLIGASASATAVNLAAAINAHTRLRGLVAASTPSAGNFTLTALLGGRMGSLIQCATTLTSCTLGGSGLFASTSTNTRVTDGFDFAMGTP